MEQRERFIETERETSIEIAYVKERSAFLCVCARVCVIQCPQMSWGSRGGLERDTELLVKVQVVRYEHPLGREHSHRYTH